jgi:hypothetical protein
MREAKMSGDVTIFVDCMRDGELIRMYDFLCPASLAGPPVLPPDESSIEQAKTNLSNERLAGPPFAEMNFVVRR